jgi:hypothetical protein
MGKFNMNKLNPIQHTRAAVILSESKTNKLNVKNQAVFNVKRKNANTLSNKLIKVWIIFSLIYAVIAIFDCRLVFKNEMNRPKRDRASATFDLIYNSDLNEEFESFVERIRFLAKSANHTRSRMHQEIIYGAKSLDHESTFDEMNWGLTVNFKNGSIIKYYDQDNTIKVIKKQKQIKEYFTFFPSFDSLHLVYKAIDFGEKADLLQQRYNRFNYDEIEAKYEQSMKSRHFRFTVYAFLVIFTPITIAYIAIRIFR